MRLLSARSKKNLSSCCSHGRKSWWAITTTFSERDRPSLGIHIDFWSIARMARSPAMNDFRWEQMKRWQQVFKFLCSHWPHSFTKRCQPKIRKILMTTLHAELTAKNEFFVGVVSNWQPSSASDDLVIIFFFNSSEADFEDRGSRGKNR